MAGGSVNKVIIVGNLGKDPEMRALQDGTKIANLTIATSETWNDRSSGDRKERTEWHRVVIFNDRTAGVAEQYLKKGAKVYVEGSLQTRKWTDQQGQERYATEVVVGKFNGVMTMLSSAPDVHSNGHAAPQGNRAPVRPAARPAAPARQAPAAEWDMPQGGGIDLDDEVPF